MDNRGDTHATQSMDHTVFRDEGEQCGSTPLVYGFAYSPGRERSMELLNEAIGDDIDDPLMATVDGPSSASETKKAIIFDSCPIGKLSRGKIEINRGFFNEYWYESQEYMSHRLLRAHRVICGFEIYTSDREECVGYLKSNIFGTKYTLYQEGKNPMYIEYTTSLFRRRGPRAFSVSLVGTSNPSQRNAQIVMKNKEPYYNMETNSYSLNFNGRVTTPSVKNFQLIHPLDPTYVTLTFGKISKFRYILDHTYPWSGLQAFAVALAALDYKIGCD